MPTDSAHQAFLITGPSAAGKSTVAQVLAQRFERGVYVEGDFFRRSIVSGRLELTPALAPDAVDQLTLRYRLAALVADEYFDSGFNVVVEDVVAGPVLEQYVGLLRARPLHVVVLMPSREVVERREAERPSSGYEHWSVDELYDGFAVATPRIGHWLDTSAQTPAETVDEILALVG